MFHCQIGSGTVLSIAVAGLLQIPWKPNLWSSPVLSNYLIINPYSVNLSGLLQSNTKLKNSECPIISTITLQVFLWQQIVWCQYSPKCSRVQVEWRSKGLQESKTYWSEYYSLCCTSVFEYGDQYGYWWMLNVGSTNRMSTQLSQICIQCECYSM